MNNLTTKLTQPDTRIIATWSKRDKKIIQFHCEKKLVDFGRESPEEKQERLKKKLPDDFFYLEETLLNMQRFVGIREPLGEAEMEMLKQFLVEELSDFSLNEIIYSIKMAVAGHLTAKVDHWQSFTAQYLMPIFRQYRTLRWTVTSKYFAAADELLEQDVKTSRPPLSKEEQFLLDKKLCEGAFENYKEKIAIIGMSNVFDILWNLNLIPYSKKRMQQFEDMAMGELKTEAKRSSADKEIYETALKIQTGKIIIDPAAAGTLSPSYEKHVAAHNAWVNKTKEIAIRNVFAYLIESGTDISAHFQTRNLEHATTEA